MIDFENQIFTAVKTKLLSEFPKLKVSGSLVSIPSDFPFVYLAEIDNHPDTRTRDTESNENHVIVSYELTVYSNKAEGKKAEAKKIHSVADDILNRMGFTRYNRQIVYLTEGTVCRLISRYTAEIGKDGTIYRR